MNVAAGPDLAAAVSNAGGLGVIGGLGYTCVLCCPCTAFDNRLYQAEAFARDHQGPQVVFELA